MSATVAILGLISALLILIRIIDPPDFGSFREVWGTVTIEGTVQPPMFLALLAAMGSLSADSSRCGQHHHGCPAPSAGRP
jgi:hypothetical protein